MNPSVLLTIDVEDWFQVENLRPWYPPTSWNSQELRVERNTHRILDLFDSIGPTNPRATFFILGWIAQRLPGLVREIKARGHEIASHGFNHLMCNQIDDSDLAEDLICSRKTLEDIIGAQVKGYRAPSFSISDKVLRLLQISGYGYDSSYNNFDKHGRYGTISLNGHKRAGIAYKMSHDLVELPISNLRLGKQIIPWGGGGYFRFIPLSIFKAGVKHILKESDAYLFYMHPWEIDYHQPRAKEPKGLSTWRHYLNLDKTYLRLHNFITTFKHSKFLTCSQYLDGIAKQGQGTEHEQEISEQTTGPH